MKPIETHKLSHSQRQQEGQEGGWHVRACLCKVLQASADLRQAETRLEPPVASIALGQLTSGINHSVRTKFDALLNYPKLLDKLSFQNGAEGPKVRLKTAGHGRSSTNGHASVGLEGNDNGASTCSSNDPRIGLHLLLELFLACALLHCWIAVFFGRIVLPFLFVFPVHHAPL